MRITEAEVRRVAELANLALHEDEISRLTRDMDGILSHMDKLNELDTSNVEPMAQVLSGDRTGMREDQERAPLSNSDAVANAPLTSGGYYKVPKVIER